MKSVIIYTDGSFKGKTKTGGWAAPMVCGSKAQVVYGGEQENATVNRMELTAVLKSLEQLNEPCKVKLVCDSQYVRKGMDTWMDEWKSNGWKTAGKGDVKNRDLWEAIDKVSEQHEIKTKWVKSHTKKKSPDHLGNKLADWFAQHGADKAVDEK